MEKLMARSKVYSDEFMNEVINFYHDTLNNKVSNIKKQAAVKFGIPQTVVDYLVFYRGRKVYKKLREKKELAGQEVSKK
jgi:hypothetical protein